jgi:hypothetical protein
MLTVLDRAYNFTVIWIAVLWVVTIILEEPAASFLRVEVSTAVMWMGYIGRVVGSEQEERQTSAWDGATQSKPMGIRNSKDPFKGQYRSLYFPGQ